MRVLDMVCCHFRREHSVDEIKILRCKLAFQEWRMQRLRSKILEEKLVRQLLSKIITLIVKRRDSIALGVAHIGDV